LVCRRVEGLGCGEVCEGHAGEERFQGDHFGEFGRVLCGLRVRKAGARVRSVGKRREDVMEIRRCQKEMYTRSEITFCAHSHDSKTTTTFKSGIVHDLDRSAISNRRNDKLERVTR
jgi:hypothetical protein